MDEAGVESLLREIRDINREHLALYKQALEKQETALRSQQEAIALQRRHARLSMLVLIPVLAVVLGLILWLVLSF